MRLISTTPDHPWHEAALDSPPQGPDDNPLRIAGPPHPLPVRGFGGCFNELGAAALFAVPEATREHILGDLFGPQGCRFRIARLPIGASDYARSWYSHLDEPGDYDLTSFSISRDRDLLLPYIKQARKWCPDLELFASPWSPPAWLKQHDRYNGSRLRPEPRVWRTYAEYLRRFVEAYRAEGVSIQALHVQNEPNSDQKFPSCLWTGAEMRDFIRDYLGPLFESSRESCEIWAGTIERGSLIGWMPDTIESDSYARWLHTILSDAACRRFVRGVGYQWNGKGALAQSRANWPDLPIIQTENECGDGQNSWAYAFYVFDLLWQYFHHGACAYVYWNMVLPPGGESTWGWKQNCLITLEPASGTITYNPEFWVMKHVASAVEPGALNLPLRGHPAALSLLFRNPSGQHVLVVGNPLPEPVTFAAEIEGLPRHLRLGARSLNTLWF